ncbi:aminotransferase class V-fold PLP-dependent enzyme [Noviherbaspirillum pedocola]|nr:aminotransferase class V-fold PLP-dependent enzyme [Noviherbaspirillum pedocola]
MLRSLFPQLEHSTYLNSCSCGALAQPVIDAVQHYLQLWKCHGGRAWYADGGWLEALDSARAHIAALLGASPHEIALAPNVSTALAALASCMDYAARPRVLTTSLDFPTLAHQWLAKASAGAHCDILPSPDGCTVPVEAFAAVVDKRTALIATARVYFTTGAIQDIVALARLAHDAGALLLVDDYQGTGQVPLDVKEANIDMLVGGTQKWLLGGPGLSFLYVHERLHARLHPSVVGWFGHAHQLDFLLQPWEPRGDARRFELGTPALPAVYAANAGMELVRKTGVDAIRRRVKWLTETLVSGLTEAGFQLTMATDPEKRAGIVMLECPDAQAWVVELARQSIIVDARPGHLRIAPHFYNDMDDIERVLKALKELEWRNAAGIASSSA